MIYRKKTFGFYDMTKYILQLFNAVIELAQ